MQAALSCRLQLSGPEKDNVKKEALRLSLKYSFVTPLTSMVVTKPTGDVTDVLHKPKEGQTSHTQDHSLTFYHDPQPFISTAGASGSLALLQVFQLCLVYLVYLVYLVHLVIMVFLGYLVYLVHLVVLVFLVYLVHPVILVFLVHLVHLVYLVYLVHLVILVAMLFFHPRCCLTLQ